MAHGPHHDEEKCCAGGPDVYGFSQGVSAALFVDHQAGQVQNQTVTRSQNQHGRNGLDDLCERVQIHAEFKKLHDGMEREQDDNSEEEFGFGSGGHGFLQRKWVMM